MAQGRRATALFAALALTGFAANSLLARVALRGGAIDAASYTAIRIVSGALMLALIVRLRGGPPRRAGHWLDAALLVLYAAPFAFAYLQLTTGAGALILFGSVQVTMIGIGLWQGERPSRREWLGLGLAVAGLVGLAAPGVGRVPLSGGALMVLAGVAWGAYSIRGRRATAPLRATAGNFLRGAPLALLPLLLTSPNVTLAGVAWATASGAIASGLGYAFWYAALPSLSATRAATLQIALPAVTAWAGVVLLDERVTPRLLVAGTVILAGVTLTVIGRKT